MSMRRLFTLRQILSVLDRKSRRDKARAALIPELPDPAVCAARRINGGSLVLCQADPDRRCEFLLVCRDLFFCGHPRRREIADRTRDMERAEMLDQPAKN